jgi:hypothetical protein
MTYGTVSGDYFCMAFRATTIIEMLVRVPSVAESNLGNLGGHLTPQKSLFFLASFQTLGVLRVFTGGRHESEIRSLGQRRIR